jgi:hypothetical protein
MRVLIGSLAAALVATTGLLSGIGQAGLLGQVAKTAAVQRLKTVPDGSLSPRRRPAVAGWLRKIE